MCINNNLFNHRGSRFESDHWLKSQLYIYPGVQEHSHKHTHRFRWQPIVCLLPTPRFCCVNSKVRASFYVDRTTNTAPSRVSAVRFPNNGMQHGGAFIICVCGRRAPAWLVLPHMKFIRLYLVNIMFVVVDAVGV